MKKLKLYIGILVGLLATMLTACTSDLSEETVPSNSKGEMTLSFKVSTPDYKIGTRSEGEEFGSSDVQIFCFDANGYFLGMGQDLTVEATSKEKIDDGAANTDNKTISVKMPNATARLHIIANANINTEKAANGWIGLHENKLITTFESKADENQALNTKYWGYCSGSTTEEMKAKLNNSSNVIHLIRDRAKITADWENTINIQSVEISIGEGMKYATIAAFDRNRLEFPNTTAAKDWEWKINDITLPKSEERYKGSAGQMGTVQYCFEDENSSKNPVSCILKVTFKDKDNTVKWYKVYLQDKDQQFYKIKRNYTYAIHIQKLNQKLGYTGYDDALNGYAANNPWIQVEQIVPKISDGIYTLEIPNGTNVMLNEGAAENQEIAFNYEGGDLNKADRFDVNWVTNNDLGNKKLTITYENGKGKIGFTRGEITDQLKSGEIRILDKVSGMSRTIKIYSITKFDFDFTFSGMSGKDKDNTGTLTYTIPSNYPSALLPVEIRIASNTINPEDCDVEVGSTEEIDKEFQEGKDWNCWFLKKFNTTADLGVEKTITLKNIRGNNSGDKGSFYVKAKYGGGLQKFEITY
ncbi:MAG: hypothetical protein ACI4B4_01475 [Segatella copri]